MRVLLIFIGELFLLCLIRREVYRLVVHNTVFPLTKRLFYHRMIHYSTVPGLCKLNIQQSYFFSYSSRLSIQNLQFWYNPMNKMKNYIMNKDILRFNIPMNNVLNVHKFKPFTDLLHIVWSLFFRTFLSIVFLSQATIA